ncbi:Regulator of nonsense transcripts 3A [Halotydeus destructor]|nr:Regulator of nonsense transcripts 3A [Halotydeus destructor]
MALGHSENKNPVDKMKKDDADGSVKRRRDSRRRDKKYDDVMSKVVIRHLPPTMTQEQFEEQISPVPVNNYMYFAKADLSLGQFAFSRAYINFVHQNDIYIFRDKFDGYVFVDSKGNEFPAIVEFAPSQKIPHRQRSSTKPIAKKRDAKSGTIEKDQSYIEFLEWMENRKLEPNLPSAEVYLPEMEAKEKELKANRGLPPGQTALQEEVARKHSEWSKKPKQRSRDRKYRDDDKSKRQDMTEKQSKPKVKSDRRDRGDRQSKETNKTTAHSSKSNVAQASVVKLLQKEKPAKSESKPEFKPEPKPVVRNEKPAQETSRRHVSEKKDSQRNQTERNDKDGSRSVRNKDRPEREIYRPRKTKEPSEKGDESVGNGEEGAPKKVVRTRVFRSHKK